MIDQIHHFLIANSNQFRVLLDVLITGVLVSMLGLEREKADKPAGLKTNIIVGSFACVIVSTAFMLIDHFEHTAFTSSIRSDPIRVLEAIVVGISFIGAGTIIKSKSPTRVYYLTTSATILYSGAIGICVALHQYVLAVGLALFITLINTLFRRQNLHSKIKEEQEQ